MEIPPSRGRGGGLKVMVSLAALVVVIGGLRAAAPLLAPIMLAFFLAVLSLPILRVWRKWKVPGFLAILLTVLVDIAVLSPIVIIGLNLITEFKVELPQLRLEFMGELERFEAFMKARFDYEISLDNREITAEAQAQVLGFIGGVAGVLKTFVFVLIITIFFLAEAGGFSRKISAIRRANGPNLKRFQNTAKDIQKYLGIKTVISAITGVAAGVLTYTLGLKFAVLWGLVAFTFNYVPAIGSIVASIPPALIALVDTGAKMEPGLGLASIVLLGYLAINMLLGNFIEPMLLGHRFGVSTSVVILSVLFWGWVWGIVGMFLAVPLTMLVKVMVDHSVDFRWLSIAMGGHEVILADGAEIAVEASSPRGKRGLEMEN